MLVIVTRSQADQLTVLERERLKEVKLRASERLVVIGALEWFQSQTSPQHVMARTAQNVREILLNAAPDDFEITFSTDLSVIDFLTSVLSDYCQYADVCEIIVKCCQEITINCYPDKVTPVEDEPMHIADILDQLFGSNLATKE